MKEAFKQYMKGSKKKVEALAPRQTAEITKEYTELCSKVGHFQYQIKVLEANLNGIFNRINELDGEASARKKLDVEAAPPEAKTGAV